MIDYILYFSKFKEVEVLRGIDYKYIIKLKNVGYRIAFPSVLGSSGSKIRIECFHPVLIDLGTIKEIRGIVDLSIQNQDLTWDYNNEEWRRYRWSLSKHHI